MQSRLNAASSELAKLLHQEFSRSQTEEAGLELVGQFAALPALDRALVREEMQRLFGDERKFQDAFDRIKDIGQRRSIDPAVFLQSQVIVLNQGAATAAPAREGQGKELGIRLQSATSASKPAAPSDSFTMLEQKLDKSDEDHARLRGLMDVLQPADRERLEATFAGIQREGTAALAAQMAMAKAMRAIDKAGGPDVQAKKDKLFADMRAHLGQMLVDNLDLSPDGIEALGLPRDMDPALVKALLMGDESARDELRRIASATGLGETPEQKVANDQKEHELTARLARSNNILALINSSASIDDILVAVMLLILEDNDEQLRQKTAELEHARTRICDMKEARKKKDSAKARHAEIRLKKLQEELQKREAQGAPKARVEAKAPTTTVEVKSETNTVKVEVQQDAQLSLPGVCMDPPKAGEQLALPGVSMDPPSTAPASTSAEVPAPEGPTPEEIAWHAENDRLRAEIANASALVDQHIEVTAEMDREIEREQQSIDKISFQIQQMADRRKQMFELINKILSVFSHLASTATQAMRV